MASPSEEQLSGEEGFCCTCKRKTKYKCIRCLIAVCNRCTKFEKDEEVEGWQEMKSVGYCLECDLLGTKNADKDERRSSSDIRFIENEKFYVC